VYTFFWDFFDFFTCYKYRDKIENIYIQTYTNICANRILLWTRKDFTVCAGPQENSVCTYVCICFCVNVFYFIYVLLT
jgi:hypothetical protein